MLASFKKVKESLGFRERFILIIPPLLIILGLGFTALTLRAQQELIRERFMNKADTIVSHLTDNSMDYLITLNIKRLKLFLADSLAQQDVKYAYVLDDDGRMLTNGMWRNPLRHKILTDAVSIKAAAAKSLLKQFQPNLLDVTQPIYSGTKKLGAVRVGFSLERMQEEINGIRRQAWLLGGGYVLIVSFLTVGIFLYFRVQGILRPLKELVEASETIARGEFHKEVDVHLGGEWKELSMAFNSMRENLEKTTVSRNYMDNIIGSMVDSLIVTSPDGHIETVNAATCALLGYEEMELVGRPVEVVFGEVEGAEEQRGAWVKETAVDHFYMAEDFFKNEKRSYKEERNYLAKDGWKIRVSLSVSRMRGEDGKIQGLVFVAQDITERKRAEGERQQLEARIQEAQKLESVGVLAGGIAHDFNNLLTSILGYTNLAQMAIPPESPARRQVEQIETAAGRAAELTNQLLAYSGKGRFVVEPLDLSILVDEMAHLLKTVVSKNVVLRFDFADDLFRILADATQIRQVVMNLITNASDAIGDKSGIITLRIRVMEAGDAYLSEAYLGDELPEGSCVCLEVADTGKGMDAETKAKIFDPFFSTKFTGRGLGLAAVLGIVRGHHGALKVESEPGRGTTFRVLLPCTDQQEEALTEKSKIAESFEGGGVVLVVDDEESVRAVTKRMLKRFGFTVLTAKDGLEGVEVFRNHSDEIAVVLLDMTMPHMGGEEAFHAIRRIRTDARIVLCSGYTEEDVTNRFAETGPAGFIQKPYGAIPLVEKIREVLQA